MQLSETSKLYDENYFAHGCGREYKRDDHWLNFFGAIAGKIVAGIQPKTVLDAGCAMGFLVEQLRVQGVEAWGVDISEYAIQNAHESIQEYVWVGSVTEPFPRKYDLIVTIEVLEHLPKEASEQALINLCQHTDDILFSSTPLDYKESTHFNVQPVEYWAELFAQQGFYRDVDFDATFITPWAARYRRKQESLPRMARDYERWVWTTRKENADLRQQAMANESTIHAISQELDVLRGEGQRQTHEIHLLRSDLNEKEQHILRLEVQVGTWEEQQATVGWKILQRIRGLRIGLAPIGSLRNRVLQWVINDAKTLTRAGVGAYVRVWKRRLTGSVGKSPQDRIAYNAAAYQNWMARHALTTADLTRQRAESAAFAYKPLLSIITPVYNPPPQVLRQTIEAILAQTYENWELCIADGNSQMPGVQEAIEEYAQKDNRIRLQRLPQNLGISGNSNAALDIAQGEFVQFLDHDDLLAPNALYEAVHLLNENPALDVIYYDEDKLSKDGDERRDPFFKPDWSPEMLLSANYLTHALMRRALVLDAGKLDPDTDGAQDWDLAFRVTERTNQIAHIPKILYHWRQVSGSTSGDFTAKPWVFDTQIRCVENHLRRTGIEQPKANFPSPGFLRVRWPVSGKKVSIIIPSKENVDFLRQCLSSITHITTYPDYEIVIVDNGSVEKETLNYYQTLRRDPRVKLAPYNQPFNYSAANNLGARHASGEILLFLNNDIEILEADWLEEMVRWAERPNVGIVGAKLLYPDLTIQHAGVVIGMEGHASHVFWGAPETYSGPFGSVDWYRNYTAVTGACMMMRRDVFDTLGGFDEAYILAFSDIEICVRVHERGLRTVYTPFARLKHYEGKTRGSHIPMKDVKIGVEHFTALVEAGDSYFNPNLSYTHRLPTIVGPNEEGRVARLHRIAAGRIE